MVLPSFNVIRPGSRATYRELFAGPEAPMQAFRKVIEERADESLRVRGLEDAGEQINAATRVAANRPYRFRDAGEPGRSSTEFRITC